MSWLPGALLVMVVLLEACIVVGICSRTYAGIGWILAPPVVLTGYFLLVQFPGIGWLAYRGEFLNPAIGAALALGGVLVGAVIQFGLRAGGSVVNTTWPLCCRVNTSGVFVIASTIVVLGLGAAAFTFAMYGRIPLLYALQGLFVGYDPDLTMHQARQMNTLHHRGSDTFYFGQGYLRVLFAQVAPLFAGVLYMRRKVKNCRGTLSVAIMSVFALIGVLNGQIWVTMQIGIFYFMVLVWTIAAAGDTGDSIKFVQVGRILVLALCAALGFVFAFRFLQFMSGRNLGDLFLSSVDRIFGYPQVALFSIFPAEEPFRYGSTWLNDLRGLLPGSIESFSYEVHALVHRSAWGFTLAPGMIASAYVNFGMVGVFGTFVFLTAIYTYIYERLICGRTLADRCIGIYVSFSFAINLLADLSAYVVSLLVALATLSFYRVAERLLVGATRSRHI